MNALYGITGKITAADAIFIFAIQQFVYFYKGGDYFLMNIIVAINKLG